MPENQKFLTDQIITYIGNKRSLLTFIDEGIQLVKNRLNKDKLSTLDGFAGSGVVSRYLKQYSNILISNDFEEYSYVINSCFLSNKSDVDEELIKHYIDDLNVKKYRTDLGMGIIEELYSPKDTKNPQQGERCFYTNENAKIIDNIRRTISEYKLDRNIEKFLISPLLIKSSINNNTGGVFKGFYKSKTTGIGKFGGDGENALVRIMGEISLEYPIFSNNECQIKVLNKDINDLVKSMKKEIDLTYYDPPYNQHPYGSNYHMLNTILNYEYPKEISDVSGIPKDWQKSNYNKKDSAIKSLNELIENTKSKFILLSYNNEGIIPTEIVKDIMEKNGKLTLLEKDYNTYRASRNLIDRNIKVKELLYVLEK